MDGQNKIGQFDSRESTDNEVKITVSKDGRFIEASGAFRKPLNYLKKIVETGEQRQAAWAARAQQFKE